MNKRNMRLVLKIVLGVVTATSAFVVFKQINKTQNESGNQQVITGDGNKENQVGNNNVGTNNGTVNHVDSGKIEINDNRKERTISVGDNNSGVNIATDNGSIKNNSK